MNFLEWLEQTKWRKWGKYVITLLVFAVVYLFVGDQSMMRFIRRGREIRSLEQQRDRYLEGTERAQRELQMLHQPDSLERYAREHYFMHMPNEEIYLVEEE